MLLQIGIHKGVKIKMKKQEMKEAIIEAGQNSENYLMNALNCMDIFWDTFNSKLNRMSKSQLEDLYNKIKNY